MCFFSIILPTFNRAHLIIPAITSIIGQTFGNWELLVIDDGSTDNTKQVVTGFNDSRIKYIFQTNQERSAARNNGIKNAAGRFICFIDSDDSWHNNHLELLYQKIVEQDFKPALYFTAMRWTYTTHTEDVLFANPQGTNRVEYVVANQIAPSTACLHSSITSEIKFNPSLIINEDVEFFARVVAKYDLIQVPEITIDFIVHEENTRGQVKNYILSQMKTMRLVFGNKELKDKFSGMFKRRVFKNLRHQLINYYNDRAEYQLMNKEILLYLFLYPFSSGNKTKLVLLLYHLPAGGLLKSLVRTLKKSFKL